MDDFNSELEDIEMFSVHDWIEYGVTMGWITPAHCSTHDGLKLTHEEAMEFEEGLDPCVHVVRLWD